MQIDLFDFSVSGGEAGGAISLTDLPRVETPDRRGTLVWRAQGSIDRSGHRIVALEIDGSIALICQRCLEPLMHQLAIRSRFRLAADEQAAAASDDENDDVDVIAGSEHFDFDTLIEDEVILSLPIAPRHIVCPNNADEVLRASGRPSPFAALGAFKTRSNESGK